MVFSTCCRQGILKHFIQKNAKHIAFGVLHGSDLQRPSTGALFMSNDYQLRSAQSANVKTQRCQGTVRRAVPWR